MKATRRNYIKTSAWAIAFTILFILFFTGSLPVVVKGDIALSALIATTSVNLLVSALRSINRQIEGE